MSRYGVGSLAWAEQAQVGGRRGHLRGWYRRKAAKAVEARHDGRYREDVNPPEKRRLSPAEAKARDERLTAAGITAARPGAAVITLLTKRVPAGESPEDDGGSGRVE